MEEYAEKEFVSKNAVGASTLVRMGSVFQKFIDAMEKMTVLTKVMKNAAGVFRETTDLNAMMGNVSSRNSNVMEMQIARMEAMKRTALLLQIVNGGEDNQMENDDDNPLDTFKPTSYYLILT